MIFWLLLYLIPYLLALLIWSRRVAVVTSVLCFAWVVYLVVTEGYESDAMLLALTLVAIGTAGVVRYIQLAPSLRGRDSRLLVAIPGALFPFVLVLDRLFKPVW